MWIPSGWGPSDSLSRIYGLDVERGLDEKHIFSYDDDPEDFYIEEVVKGSSVEDVLDIMQYNPKAMASDVKRMIDSQISTGNMKPREAVRWTDFYERCLQGYTYLKP